MKISCGFPAASCVSPPSSCFNHMGNMPRPNVAEYYSAGSVHANSNHIGRFLPSKWVLVVRACSISPYGSLPDLQNLASTSSLVRRIQTDLDQCGSGCSCNCPKSVVTSKRPDATQQLLACGTGSPHRLPLGHWLARP